MSEKSKGWCCDVAISSHLSKHNFCREPGMRSLRSKVSWARDLFGWSAYMPSAGQDIRTSSHYHTRILPSKYSILNLICVIRENVTFCSFIIKPQLGHVITSTLHALSSLKLVLILAMRSCFIRCWEEEEARCRHGPLVSAGSWGRLSHLAPDRHCMRSWGLDRQRPKH